MSPQQCKNDTNQAYWKRGFLKILFPVTGLLALVWFLVRVIPKPSRATYPCQRAAFPLASAFVIWMTGVIVSLVAFRRAQRLLKRSRMLAAALSLLVGVGAVYWSMSMNGQASQADQSTWYEPGDPANAPMGIGRGIHPGRVVWTHDPDATSWDGERGRWYDSENTDEAVVGDMLNNVICDLVEGVVDAPQAWDALFRYFNQRRGKGNVGYRRHEKIAVKICGYGSKDSQHDQDTDDCVPGPQILLALLRQLDAAGVDDDKVTIYDATSHIPDFIFKPCKAEFPNVHFAEWTGSDGREKTVPDTTAQVVWSDDLKNPTEIPNSQNDVFLPSCASQADYIISLGNLKGHTLAGVTLCAKNHFGSMCTTGYQGSNDTPTRAAPKGAGLHPYIAVHDFALGNWQWECFKRPMGTYNPLVDLMAHQELGEKTVLCLIDGLYAVDHQHTNVSLDTKWESAPFYGDWSSLLIASQDYVAIESVGLDFLRSEPVIQADPDAMGAGDTVDNYLHEAALAYDPPSGTFYDPEGDGVAAPSLGVHEHWNNPLKKQYSRNLKTGEGIELIRSPRVYGDIDSGGVDMADLLIITKHWLRSDCDASNHWCNGADINRDHLVNLQDYLSVAGDWGTHIITETPVAELQEPAEKDPPNRR